MKNTLKLLTMFALIAVIGFSMTTCDNGSTGGGGGDDESSFTIQGSYDEDSGRYDYGFISFSSYIITITINKDKITLPPGHEKWYDSSSSSITFKYSPSDKLQLRTQLGDYPG